MIGVPVTPNSVYVSMVYTGCGQIGFDSTYPIHLNGIISEDEFKTSLKRINRRTPLRGISTFFTIILVTSMLSGMISVAVGMVTAINSMKMEFPPLVGIGLGLFIFGMIISAIKICISNLRNIERLQKVIAEESLKYSSRSPTPCSWRLEPLRMYAEGYENDSINQLGTRLVIDIDYSTASASGTYYCNQLADESTLLLGRQDNCAPPPYSGPSIGVCSQCNVPRRDRMDKFCSSCGHSFDQS